MSADSWTAIGTWVLALGTLYLVHRQIRSSTEQLESSKSESLQHIGNAYRIASESLTQQKLLESSRSITDFRHRYRSDDMAHQRQGLATWLLTYDTSSPTLKGINDLPLNIFETVGFLTRKKALDDEMVWCEFCYPVTHYYQALKNRGIVDHVRTSLGDDQTIFREFEWLAKALMKIDARERRTSESAATPSDADVDAFLKRERAPREQAPPNKPMKSDVE